MEFYKTEKLIEHGLILPAPEAVFVDKDVALERLAPGVTLYPGARIHGSRTVLAPESSVGTHGPARVENVALGRGASIASGTVEDCCLLNQASLGPNSHVRAGTLLEESCSTGHSVGLKQTVLLSFVTLGSQINFCDCLMSGGTSRRDHSEVGSGFIHFNFTPFGERGDKATASLFGDVCSGVFLKSPRIFLGGSGGVVGPIHVDFGTTLAAGSVYRRDYASGVLVYGEKTISKSKPFDPLLVRRVRQRTRRSLRYIGELRALYAWYRDVRLPATDDFFDRLVIDSAMERIAEGVKERCKQIGRFLEGAHPADDAGKAELEETVSDWSGRADAVAAMPATDSIDSLRDAFLADLEPKSEHIEWVQSLRSEQTKKGRSWLLAFMPSGSSLED